MAPMGPYLLQGPNRNDVRLIGFGTSAWKQLGLSGGYRTGNDQVKAR